MSSPGWRLDLLCVTLLCHYSPNHLQRVRQFNIEQVVQHKQTAAIEFLINTPRHLKHKERSEDVRSSLKICGCEESV